MAGERGLEVHEVEAIYLAFAEVMYAVPPDPQGGLVGDLRLTPDIGRKFRTALDVGELLSQFPYSRDDACRWRIGSRRAQTIPPGVFKCHA